MSASQKIAFIIFFGVAALFSFVMFCIHIKTKGSLKNSLYLGTLSLLFITVVVLLIFNRTIDQKKRRVVTTKKSNSTQNKNSKRSKSRYQIHGYDIIEQLGYVSTGAIFKGYNRQRNMYAAIKILSNDSSNNPAYVESFIQENNQGFKINHPNIVSVFKAGKFRGRLYYIMEFVDGITVREELVSNGAYNEQKAINIGLQAAQALEYANSLDIQHPRLNTNKIIITQGGQIKIYDLHVVTPEYPGGTITRFPTKPYGPDKSMNNSPIFYIAPENLTKEKPAVPDELANIYSLGAILYNMLTGIPPLYGFFSNPIQVVEGFISEKPLPHIQTLNPNISNEVCQVVDLMMKINRNKRYQSISDVVKDLVVL
ncbi:serine/threonine-protein kinase [Candidatus Uabimicrobium sp. HlEnr_7]|uniref:serine/threonine-protein kinase n=1 Tax=Candidatus Uabimicrobium helgolandensis TaxID=3095367 RepID=UPI003557FF25